MTLFQIIVLIFIVFVFLKIFKKYQEKVISSREMIFWGLLWLVAALLITWPGTTSFLASQLGIGRGVDLVIYVAMIANFYLIFRLYVRAERQEKNITRLVQKIALKNPERNEQAEKTDDSKLTVD